MPRRGQPTSPRPRRRASCISRFLCPSFPCPSRSGRHSLREPRQRWRSPTGELKRTRRSTWSLSSPVARSRTTGVPSRGSDVTGPPVATCSWANGDTVSRSAAAQPSSLHRALARLLPRRGVTSAPPSASQQRGAGSGCFLSLNPGDWSRRPEIRSMLRIRKRVVETTKAAHLGRFVRRCRLLAPRRALGAARPAGRARARRGASPTRRARATVLGHLPPNAHLFLLNLARRGT